MSIYRRSLPLAGALVWSLVAGASQGHAQGIVTGKTPLTPLQRHTQELLSQPVQSEAKLTLVFVLDGLRPDSINAYDTPNLYRLREAGVNFQNGHAVFPTVTRVNAPSISTGYYPSHAGILSNSIFVPEIDPTGDISTGDWTNLTKLDEVSDGQLLFVQTLAQRLHAEGKTLAAVSSGSTGSAYLLNPHAQDGVGVLINRDLGTDEAPRVAFPDAVNDTVLARFGTNAGPEAPTEPTDWAETVLRDYVLPELKPDVVLNWITQPDGAQHANGAGSPEAVEVIRNDDRNIGLILDKVAELNLLDQTNIFVVSDHGFGVYTYDINLEQSLIDAGLKQGTESGDVVVASSGQAALIHVEDHSPRTIARIVRHLQAQPWASALFTRAPRWHRHGEISPYGFVPGTFSLELIYQDNDLRGADILLTFDWSSARNAFGVQGTDGSLSSGETGPRDGNSSGHGSMSPWTVHNSWLAWGVDFKQAIVDRVPASNVDIAPTIAATLGLATDDFDGRVLREAMVGGVDHEKVPSETRTYQVRTRRGYSAVIQVTEVAHQRYVDKSWRLH